MCVLLKQTQQLRRLRNFEQHPSAAEKSQTGVHRQDVQGLRVAKQPLLRQHSPYETKT